jgi:Do/DeqQ family serine protease
MNTLMAELCRSRPWVGVGGFRVRGRSAIIFLCFVFLFPGPVAGKSSLRRTPVVEAVEKVGPTVVNISTIYQERVNPVFPFSDQDFFRDFFPDLFTREFTRTSLGSGVVVDGRKGYIVTNHHVVSGASEIKAITSDRKEYQAKIIGSAPRSDLAVLQVDLDRPIPDLQLGHAKDIMIGETVIAIGNPFGLSNTVTTGVVSALNRSVRVGDHVYRNFIQTDASINPGNSGGPLLNIEGDLIGINTAVYQKAQGIGFAIPVDKARRIVAELLRAGEVRLPWLGIEVQALTDRLKERFKLAPDSVGILVSDINAGSPAFLAGIQRGDILIELGGIPLSEPLDYRDALAEFTPQDQLLLRIVRQQGKEIALQLQATVFPLELAQDLFFNRLGIRVGNAGRGILRRYGLNEGVAIADVRGNSPGARSGLQQDDLILKINDTVAKNLVSFKKAVSRYRHDRSITLLVRRGSYGYSVTLPF